MADKDIVLKESVPDLENVMLRTEQAEKLRALLSGQFEDLVSRVALLEEVLEATDPGRVGDHPHATQNLITRHAEECSACLKFTKFKEERP